MAWRRKGGMGRAESGGSAQLKTGSGVRVRSAGSRCQGRRWRGEKLRPRRAVCAHFLLQWRPSLQVRVALHAGDASSWQRFPHFQPLLFFLKGVPSLISCN